MKLFEKLFPNQEEGQRQESRELPLWPTSEETDLEKGEVEKEDFLDGGSIGDAKFIKFKNGGAGVFKTHRRLSPELRRVFINAERAAYTVDRLLGFDLVPPTVIREIDGEIGSLQRFVPHFKLLSEIQRLVLSSEERLRLELFDALIMNPDRHSGNVLVKNGHAIAIDNGSGFSSPAEINFLTNIKLLWHRALPQKLHRNLEYFKDWSEGQEYLRRELTALFDQQTADAYVARIVAFAHAIDERGYLSEDRLRKAVGCPRESSK